MSARLSVSRLLPYGHNLKVLTQSSSFDMVYSNDDNEWTVTIPNYTKNSPYYYSEFSGSVLLRKETFPHLFPSFSTPDVAVELRDQWNDIFEPFSPKFFHDFVYSRPVEERFSLDKLTPPFVYVVLRVKWESIPSGYNVYATGGHALFGKWDTNKAVLLKSAGNSWWECQIPITEIRCPFEYKFFMKNSKKGQVYWENGGNRLFAPLVGGLIGSQKAVVYQEDKVIFPGCYKSAGVKISVSGIRSNSLGCGDLLDIQKVVDFCVKSGLSVVELLSINDYEKNPSTPMSLNAIDPMLINVSSLDNSEDIKELILAGKIEIGDFNWVDREKVIKVKERVLRAVFDKHQNDYTTVTKILFSDEIGTTDVEKFVSENRSWLLPYIVFKTVGMECAPTLENLKKVVLNQTHECVYNVFLQFTAFSQLKCSSHYAKTNHVGLMCNLAFSVDHFSVDTWIHANLFKVDRSIKDPKTNEYFGVPYNWSEMERDGFTLLKTRMELYKTIFPIIKLENTILYFRAWEMIDNKNTGFFDPQNGYTRQELSYKGINDVDRLIYPYIRDHTLELLFGEDKDFVIENYLVDNKNGTFNLAPNYRSEEDISNKTGLRESRASDKKIILGLKKLVKNVCMYSLNDKYVPTPFMLETLSSFLELDDNTKEDLRKIYVDFFERRNVTLWKQQGKKVLNELCDDKAVVVGDAPNDFWQEMKDLKMFCFDSNEYNSIFEIPSKFTIRSYYECYRNDICESMGWTDMKQFCESGMAEQIIERKMEGSQMFVVFNLQDYEALKEDYIRNKNPYLESWVIDDTFKYINHIKVDDLNNDYELIQKIQSIVSKTGRIMN
ncbi:hypothetical protein EIN_246800 [Entamoeba invadens IP1]|uniref:4-alpha-glucanotransferase n=1 Tax=Entamoeba invadens IP1 TaxID=370355 RepID=A0A0A1UDV6_ENTIV|nr:hypothetical protein EIN_246800 [Entamoeba invadens IP1]ELP94786.1 hypothetical protein EIN_246800 [Entamoeba invadens IP1]|eukprot:XP_004261557.1 hypothetical protein EIN_246800 [Entamoeba invadens IP1]